MYGSKFHRRTLLVLAALSMLAAACSAEGGGDEIERFPTTTATITATTTTEDTTTAVVEPAVSPTVTYPLTAPLPDCSFSEFPHAHPPPVDGQPHPETPTECHGHTCEAHPHGPAFTYVGEPHPCTDATYEPPPDPPRPTVPTTTTTRRVVSETHDHGPVPEPDHDHTAGTVYIEISDLMPPARGQPAPPFGIPDVTAGIGPTASPAVQAFTDWCFWDLPGDAAALSSEHQAALRDMAVTGCSRALRTMTYGLSVVDAGTPAEACVIAAYRSNLEVDGGDWDPLLTYSHSDGASAGWWGDCATRVNAVPWGQADKSDHCATAVESLRTAGHNPPEGWCDVVVYGSRYPPDSGACADALRLARAYLHVVDPGYASWDSGC